MKHLKIYENLENLALHCSRKGFLLTKLREFYQAGYKDGFKNGRSKEWSYDAVRPGHPINTYPGFDTYNDEEVKE